MFALLLGLLSLVAVREMRVDCQNQAQGLNSGGALGGNTVGALGLNAQQCYLDMGDFRVPLPAWAQAITRRVALARR